jgi:hypothetical protein
MASDPSEILPARDELFMSIFSSLWPNPSLALTKGTWLGALSLTDIFTTPINVDVDSETCKVQIAFPPGQQKPIEPFVDAFLYLGPQDFRLNEPMPADIALDADYMTELRRRESLIGFPGESSKSQKEFSDEIVQEAQNPILEEAPTLPNARDIEQSCLADQKRAVLDSRQTLWLLLKHRDNTHRVPRPGVLSAMACFQQLLQFARHPFQSCGQAFVEACPTVIRESAVQKHIASRSIRSFGQKRTNPPPGKGILTRTS